MKKFLAILLALVMVLSLVACGDKKDDVDDNNDTPIVDDVDDSSKEQQDNEDKDDEDIDDIDGVKDVEDIDSDDVDVNVKESGKKVEWQIGNVTYIYTHDGEKVTGYEVRMDMGDTDTAKTVITAYKLNADEDDTIDDVSRDGQFIVVKYNEKGFEYTSYEDLKSASDTLNSLYGN